MVVLSDSAKVVSSVIVDIRGPVKEIWPANDMQKLIVLTALKVPFKLHDQRHLLLHLHKTESLESGKTWSSDIVLTCIGIDLHNHVSDAMVLFISYC